MPTRHKNPPPLKRDATPARALRERHGLANGVFRCDRCDRVLPLAVEVEQDGLSFCGLCRDKTSRSELDLKVAEQTSVVDSFEPNPSSPGGNFDGAVTVTGFTPALPITVSAPGGSPAATALVVSGVGFTSDIAISYSNTEVPANTASLGDDSGPTITSTSITLSIIQDATIQGNLPQYWHLTIAGTTFRNAIKVTSIGLFP